MKLNMKTVLIGGAVLLILARYWASQLHGGSTQSSGATPGNRPAVPY